MNGQKCEGDTTTGACRVKVPAASRRSPRTTVAAEYSIRPRRDLLCATRGLCVSLLVIPAQGCSVITTCSVPLSLFFFFFASSSICRLCWPCRSHHRRPSFIAPGLCDAHSADGRPTVAPTPTNSFTHLRLHTPVLTPPVYRHTHTTTLSRPVIRRILRGDKERDSLVCVARTTL